MSIGDSTSRPLPEEDFVNDKWTKLKARIVFVLLILISLAIPSLYYSFSHEAMISTRGALMLTPAPYLFVNWFGELATLMSVVLIGLFAVSWKEESLLKWQTLCGIAVAMLIYATAYGVWCCFLLSWLLLDQAGH